MPGEVTLRGPKVHAERGATADAGGGQIYADAGDLAIQGPVRGRKLGALSQLGKVVFHDHRGRESDWTFGDGTRWTLRCDNDELLTFCRDLATQLGRPSLIVQPPDPKAQLMRATGERKADLLFLGAAIGLLFAAKWLVGRAGWLGYALSIASLVALGISAAGHLAARQAALANDGKPPALAPLSRMVARIGPVAAFLLPICVIVGALLGISDAAQEGAAKVVREERRAAVTAEQAAEAAQQEAAVVQVRNQAETKLAAMAKAMAADDFEAAARLHAEAKALDPKVDGLATAWQTLEPKLQASRDARRQRDIVSGLALARQVSEDRVLCEAAKAVSDAWAKLKQTRPDDPTYDAATKLVPKLEQCRKRVVATFAAGANTARAQARLAWSGQLEQELRKRGVAASVKTEGTAVDQLTIAVDNLSAETMERIRGGSPTLAERAASEGFARLTIRAGRKKRVSRLTPDRGQGVRAALEPFGLADPFAL